MVKDTQTRYPIVEPLLTHFQTWILFMTCKNEDEWFTVRALLRQCCESSLQTLQPDNVETELKQLVTAGYLDARVIPDEKATLSLLSPKLKAEYKYRIGKGGILYVRQLYIALRDRVRTAGVPPDVINRQSAPLRDELKQKVLNVRTLLTAGIDNIGPIMGLARILLGISS